MHELSNSEFRKAQRYMNLSSRLKLLLIYHVNFTQKRHRCEKQKHNWRRDLSRRRGRVGLWCKPSLSEVKWVKLQNSLKKCIFFLV